MLPLSLLLACGTEPAAPAAPPTVPAPPPAPTSEAGEPVEAPAGRPPVISKVTVAPPRPRVADELVAQVEATDPDGDPLDLDYAWFVDGQEIIGRNADRLEAGVAKKGQQVRVEVRASDGNAEARAASEPVAVRNTEPVFEEGSEKITRIDGARFRAVDADGDEITWRIDGGPPGLTMSPEGTLSYKGSPSDPGGDYVVKVIGEDGEGKCELSFPMQIQPGSASKKADK